jgi:HEAT repeat protein
VRDAALSQGPLWEFRRLRSHFEALQVVLDKEQPSSARNVAAAQLRELKTADDLPLFRDLLRDDDAGVRCTAIHSVAVIEYCMKKSKLCPREFVAALFDPDPEVRSLAASYVSIFEEFPLDCLPRCLALTASNDPVVRMAAATCLYHFGWASRMALPELTRLCGDEDWFVRHNAANSLWYITRDGKLVVPVMVENLVRIENDSPDKELHDVRFACIWYRLSESARQSPRSVGAALLDLLKDPSPEFRGKAARLLGALADDNADTKDCFRELQADERLRKLLDDGDGSVRFSAARALQRIDE